MPNADALTTVLTIRSHPPLLVYLLALLDDPEQRRRLSGLGTFEYRIGSGDWRPLDMERQN